MKSKDKETITETGMHDIIRFDLTSEINEFSKHVQNKIERLDERMRFVNYKFEDVRFWFKRYSISIIYLATFLTLIEALMNSFNLENLENNTVKNFLKFSPLLISSLVSLIAAIIKFNKYEEKIEDITIATEKCIITIAKLKEVKEELYFCKTVTEFTKINDRFTRDIYTEYLESNTNIERQLLDTDYAKYMKRIANNDIKRAKILLKRNNELDILSQTTLNNFRLNPIKSNYKQINLNDDSSSNNTDDNKKEDFVNNKKRMNISAHHNCIERPIPYRGTSPPPNRSNISNKKMTPKTCNKCERNYLLDVNDKYQRCPYCKTLQEELNIIIDEKYDIERGLSPINKIEKYANCIQRHWRKHRLKHLDKYRVKNNKI